jgi:hypothetical protein
MTFLIPACNFPYYSNSSPIYSSDSPSAHRTREHPARTVSWAPISLIPTSRVGLTSTKSYRHICQQRFLCAIANTAQWAFEYRDGPIGMLHTIATKEPVSCTHSAMKSPSLSVRPPLTGVPVLGAQRGSRASTSNDRCIGVSFPM